MKQKDLVQSGSREHQVWWRVLGFIEFDDSGLLELSASLKSVQISRVLSSNLTRNMLQCGHLCMHSCRYEIKKSGIQATIDGPGMGAYATYGPNKEYWIGFDTQETLRSKVRGRL